MRKGHGACPIYCQLPRKGISPKTRIDIDALAAILFGMHKPHRERRAHIRDLMRDLDFNYIRNGKCLVLK